MPEGVFITATDTGVGKTLISASLAWKLSKHDDKICVMKPFATSNKVFSNKFYSKDLYLLSKSINLTEDQSYLNPFFYSLPASPYMASKILKAKPPSITTALNKFSYLRKKYNFVIVEGIGGVMVPINRKYSLVDFIRLTRLPVIIVTKPIIGTINHTLLTIQKCKEHNIPIKGIIFNKMPEKPDIVMESTPSFIERMTKIPVLGIIPNYKYLKFNANTFKKISDKIRYAI